MSIAEMGRPDIVLPVPETAITANDVIANMQAIAPPGQDILDPFTHDALTLMTKELVLVEGDKAIAEYERYNGVRDRELKLPEDKLREQLQGKIILVTGGTGLIGSALLGEIAKYGPARMVSVSRGETPVFNEIEGVNYVQADVRDAEAIDTIMQATQPDIVYHVAADKYNHEAEKRAHHTLTTNIQGTQNVIAAAQNAGVNQLVYASTGKATRPYSPDIYASSKKTGEWLMSVAAKQTDMLCSAGRFTHVVDDSNVRRKIHESITLGQPVRLQSPDVYMYIQSARESAQLLLNAGLEAKSGRFHVQAIRNLDMPINLMHLGLGAIASTNAEVPLYFGGTMPGYEDKAWPLLYGIECGDYSPLVNALETEEAQPSVTCPDIDMFPLDIETTPELLQSLGALYQALAEGLPGEHLRQVNQQVGWSMLGARLAKLPEPTLKRLHKRVVQSKNRDDLSEEHQSTHNAVLAAAVQRLPELAV